MYCSFEVRVLDKKLKMRVCTDSRFQMWMVDDLEELVDPHITLCRLCMPWPISTVPHASGEKDHWDIPKPKLQQTSMPPLLLFPVVLMPYVH